MGELRAEADVLVARAYNCSEDDLRLMLDDFPLLDRGQTALLGELSSTMTKDFLLSTWLTKARGDDQHNAERVKSARQLGAIPYVSSEFANSIKEKLNEAVQ